MHRGPSVAPLAQVRRYALLSRDANQGCRVAMGVGGGAAECFPGRFRATAEAGARLGLEELTKKEDTRADSW